MSKADYPYVQYSTEMHSHRRGKGATYSHRHRTWPTIHGHGGCEVRDDVKVHRIEPDGTIGPALTWEALERMGKAGERE